MKVNILKLKNADFPAVLKPIPMPPKQLYCLGAEPAEWVDQPKVAIVGSRKMSAYGQAVTERLAGQLAAAGVVIISGLALGVDAAAHQAALKNGGLTVAVLPTSVEKIYPASHAGLARRIIEAGGSILSEYAKADQIYITNFTYRNRLISGLADGVLITEAAARSGSLNTARFALEQGKTIMAVPGNITSAGSEGTNQLIKSGAIAVTEVEDIFFALGLKPARQARAKAFQGSQQEIDLLNLVSRGISDQEELAIELGLGGGEIAGLLTSLEINGQIRPAGGGQWIKI